MACADSLRSKCFRGRSCRYFHPPLQIQELLLKAIGLENTKATMICRDFIRGRCLREAKECHFAHHSSIDKCAIVCQDFIYGRCERKSCRYSHTLLRSVPQDQLQQQELSVKLNDFTLPEIPNASLLDYDAVPVCKDFLNNACKRDSCKYFHLIPQIGAFMQHHGPFVKPSSSPRSRTEQRTLSVCKDFLKNDCQRDSCKYAHPNLQIKVVDSQVEICRDFHRGLCHRTSCHFYHLRALSAEKH